jgi:RNA polymerase sigma factor (sigma-70 family)
LSGAVNPRALCSSQGVQLLVLFYGSIRKGFSKMSMKEYYASSNDGEIWTAFKQGCDHAFAHIYQRYSSMLFSYGMHIAPDQDQVKDCLQGLFVDLWDSRENLGDTNSIKYYLFKCLKRRIVGEILAQKKYQSMEELSGDYDFEMVFPHECHLVLEQAHQEENAHLLQAIGKLTKRQKEAIYLLYYSKLSHQEVASVMAVKVTAVYNLVYHALISLKKNMPLANRSY